MAETPSTELQKLLDIVSSYENEFRRWQERVQKILKRYRDDNRNQNTGSNETAKYNILWANVQTLTPAVYARMPKADVSRRFGDNDPVGRVASLLLERALDYEIEHYSDFRSTMQHCVEDRFLGGRGTSWVRYEPTLKSQDVEVTDEGEESEGVLDEDGEEKETPEEIDYECSPTDYVHWKDFGHDSARIWEEVTKVWRWVYMDKDAVEKRFPDYADKISFDAAPDPLNRYTKDQIKDKAKICELWDRTVGKVCWFQKSCPEILDERDDPLGLEGFFPCPKPLYATTTSDNLVPIPDFVLYQDQANELDILSDRIDGLIKALRVRGIYDASQPALQRLLTEGDNNTLIGTDKWGAFSEKGGLKGSIDLLPLDTIAAALLQCYQAQTNVKSQIYEITGISDIVRGETAASETATAQQIKGQYVGLRLRSMQDSVAMFASELLRLKAQIICDKFQDETILSYAGASELLPVDQQMIPEALKLLRDKPLRCFRIEVDADSLVQIDENQNKQDRLEYANSISTFIREAVTAGAQVPELAPAMMEMIKYISSGFKQAKPIEGEIDIALQQLQAKAAHLAANPQPSPEQMKLQSEQQIAQMKSEADLQAEQAKGQYLLQIEQLRTEAQAAAEANRLKMESALKEKDMALQQDFDRWKAALDNDTKILVAQIAAGQQVNIPDNMASTMAMQSFQKALGEGLGKLAEHMTNLHQAQGALHAHASQSIIDALAKANGPKRIVRGPDGRAIGTEPMPEPQPPPAAPQPNPTMQ